MTKGNNQKMKKEINKLSNEVSNEVEFASEQQKKLLKEKVLEKILNYFQVFDLTKKTSHKRTIELLYLSDRKYSDDEIADEVFICKRTLYRYKKMYRDIKDKLVKSMLMELNQISETIGENENL